MAAVKSSAPSVLDGLLAALDEAKDVLNEAKKKYAEAEKAAVELITGEFGELCKGTSRFQGCELELCAIVPTTYKFKDDSKVGEFREELHQLKCEEVVVPKYEFSKSAYNAALKKFGADPKGKEKYDRLVAAVDGNVEEVKGKYQLSVEKK